MNITIKRFGATTTLVLATAALAGATFFYWRSLLDESVPARAPIPNSALQSTGGFGAYWRVPKAMQARRWFRTGARVWEAGRALPLRVEQEAMVIAQGQGRFCVQGERLCFSASDSTDPATNGRSYEFEVRRPDYHAAVMAVALLVVALGLGAGLLPLRRWWRQLAQIKALAGAGRERTCRRAGLVLLCLVALPWLASLTGIFRQIPIPSEDILQQQEGHFCYFLPRWVRRQPLRVESAVLLEDQKPLRRVSLGILKGEEAKGSYVCENDYVVFRASDLSAPAVNGHNYSLRVLFLPREATVGLAFFFGSIGLLAWGQARRTGAPALELHSPLAGWWLPMLVVALGKLWVVAGEESVAADFDSVSYATSAVNMIWGGDFPLPTHTAGFSLVAGIVAQFGLPWRMALELLYLCACSYTALTVIDLAGSRLTGFLAFSLMAWHPWTLSAFGNFMSDPVVAVLLVALLGAMFRLLSRPAADWKWTTFLQIGGLLFLWDWSRIETPLVCASYGLFAGLALLATRSEANRTRPGPRRMVLLLAVPLVMVFGLSSAVKWINYQRFGIYAKNILGAPGLTALMKALYRVRPEEDVRYAPVTRQSLRAACEASPTLKPFEEALLDPKIFGWREPGEFGPDLIWLLAWVLGERSRADDERMVKAAREIELALQEGRLPRRHAWYPLDPNWRLWLADYPRACLRCLKEGASLDKAAESWGTWRHPIMQQTFDLAANRRAASIYPCALLAEGKLEAPPGLMDSVALSDEHGKWLGAAPVFLSSFPSDHGQWFDLRAPVQDPPAAYRLVFFQQGKPQYTVEFKLPPLAPGASPDGGTRILEKRESGIALPATGEKFSYYFKTRLAETARKGRRESAEKVLAGEYWWMLLYSLAIVFVWSFCGGAWERSRLRAGVLCLLLVAGCFAGRAGLYGLVESSAGWAPERYMRCASPLFLVILFLTTAVAAGFIRKWMRPNPASSTSLTDAKLEPQGGPDACHD
jgi:hypothetical protein